MTSAPSIFGSHLTQHGKGDIDPLPMLGNVELLDCTTGATHYSIGGCFDDLDGGWGAVNHRLAFGAMRIPTQMRNMGVARSAPTI